MLVQISVVFRGRLKTENWRRLRLSEMPCWRGFSRQPSLVFLNQQFSERKVNAEDCTTKHTFWECVGVRLLHRQTCSYRKGERIWAPQNAAFPGSNGPYLKRIWATAEIHYQNLCRGVHLVFRAFHQGRKNHDSHRRDRIWRDFLHWIFRYFLQILGGSSYRIAHKYWRKN